jgi:hypothetical protein
MRGSAIVVASLLRRKTFPDPRRQSNRFSHRENVRAGTVRPVLTYVLGAPGSGKSAIAALLPRQLPGHVVLDWDAFMGPASELARRDVTRSPTTWPAYRRLVRLVVESVPPAPCVLLGVCTPDELDDWPIDAWVLLDCSDEERRERLADRLQSADVDEAIADATRYRTLGLPLIDASNRVPEQVAEAVARFVIEAETTRSREQST